VDRLAADNIDMYGMPREKFRTMWMAEKLYLEQKCSWPPKTVEL